MNLKFNETYIYLIIFFFLFQISAFAKDIVIQKGEVKSITFDKDFISFFLNEDIYLTVEQDNNKLNIKNLRLRPDEVNVLTIIFKDGDVQNIKIRGKNQSNLRAETEALLLKRKKEEYTGIRLSLNYGNYIDREFLENNIANYQVQLLTKNRNHSLDIRHWGALDDFQNKIENNRPDYSLEYGYLDKYFIEYNRASSAYRLFVSPISGKNLNESLNFRYTGNEWNFESMTDRDTRLEEPENFGDYQVHKALYNSKKYLFGLLYETDNTGLLQNYLFNNVIRRNKFAITTAINVNVNNREDNISEFVENLSYTTIFSYNLRKKLSDNFEIRNLTFQRNAIIHPTYTFNDILTLPQVNNTFTIQNRYKQLNHNLAYINFSDATIFRETVNNIVSWTKGKRTLFGRYSLNRVVEEEELIETNVTYSFGQRYNFNQNNTWLISYDYRNQNSILDDIQTKFYGLTNSYRHYFKDNDITVQVNNNITKIDRLDRYDDRTDLLLTKRIDKDTISTYRLRVKNLLNEENNFVSHTLNGIHNIDRNQKIRASVSYIQDENRDRPDGRFSIGYNYLFETDKTVFKLLDRQEISGKVFHDKNFNGKFDNGEQLLSNVNLEILTEGSRKTTKTNENGFFEFSRLKDKSYNLYLVNSSFVISGNSYFNLREGDKVDQMIPLVQYREIEVSSLDTKRSLLIDNITYEVSCKSINWRKKITNSPKTLIMNIPKEDDCILEVDLFSFPSATNTYIEPQKISENNTKIQLEFDLVDNLKIQFFVDKNNNKEYDVGEEINISSVKYLGKNYTLSNGEMSLNMRENKVFNSRSIKLRKYKCEEREFKAESDFFDKTIYIQCYIK